jgi:acyl-CoA dehydrogenase
MLSALWIVAVIVGLVALAYVNASGRAWAAGIAAAIAAAWVLHALPLALTLLLAIGYVVLAIPLAVPSLRRKLVSDGVLSLYRKVLPPMSQTEREAIEAGTVWWDGELFSGHPDWSRLMATPPPSLTAEEQSFLDGETETLCAMTNDWEASSVYRDLPPAAWQYMKDKGFFGMIIPKEYGGLGFSAFAHSQVITKLSTRSGTSAVTVMVPNSLGPGELLLHYGTQAQKQYYLPRLAKGLEIPCFALTNPYAGSDAAAIPDYAFVRWGEHEGKRVLGLSVTWEKRYITLAPVATLIGLAFRVYDPEKLLGEKEELGITCALIPSTHPGVHAGRRHMPLNWVFQNGPTSGRDVFIPMDWVIGGQPMIGKGWRMLMESLAAGRGISLPSSNTGLGILTARAVGGYARVRTQFKVPVGKFEGVEEPLARIGGYLYSMDAMRRLTTAAIDLGEKPAVISAILKYHITERARQIINDGMDVIGGKGIMMGPSNFLGGAYMQHPVAITVEGANILTRSLIIFGQGAIRCHPYLLKEISATRDEDREAASIAFDEALFGHLRFTLGNLARTLVMGLTGSHFVGVNVDVAPETRRYYQQLTRFSAALAFLADVSMGTLGGALKRKEKLSARLGDILSLMYVCSATLRRFEAEGRQAADAPLMHWAIWDAMFKAQNAFEGVISNFPNRAIASIARRVVFPLGRPYAVPSDRLGHEVASLLIAPSATRDRLTANVFIGKDDDDPVGLIERALAATVAAEPGLAKVRLAIKEGRLDGHVAPDAEGGELSRRALAAGVIDAAEAQLLSAHEALVARVVAVDDFDRDLGASLLLPALRALERQAQPVRERAAA